MLNSFIQDSSDPQSMKHEDYVKQFNSEEVKYLRHLNMLIKVCCVYDFILLSNVLVQHYVCMYVCMYVQ